jgi:hypothetical protein
MHLMADAVLRNSFASPACGERLNILRSKKVTGRTSSEVVKESSFVTRINGWMRKYYIFIALVVIATIMFGGTLAIGVAFKLDAYTNAGYVIVLQVVVLAFLIGYTGFHVTRNKLEEFSGEAELVLSMLVGCAIFVFVFSLLFFVLAWLGLI